MTKATFAAGCFWGVEATFRRVAGVVATRVGYCGGSVEAPGYAEVCSGTTGHAEAIELDYDSTVVTYEQLLEVFWSCHDPTTRDRQGPDVGTQYRSVVFYHDEQQREAAQASKRVLDGSGRLAAEIVTEIVAVTVFWPAEQYHQRYYEKAGFRS